MNPLSGFSVIRKHVVLFILFTVAMTSLTGMIALMSETAVVHAASFTVNVTADATDTNPGDGICEIDTPPSGLCTLRAAIQEANALPGRDHIVITNGVHTINRDGVDDIAFVGVIWILQMI